MSAHSSRSVRVLCICVLEPHISAFSFFALLAAAAAEVSCLDHTVPQALDVVADTVQ